MQLGVANHNDQRQQRQKDQLHPGDPIHQILDKRMKRRVSWVA
jgi:hypothetical protein